MGLLIDEEFKIVKRTIPYGAKAIHLGRRGVLLDHHPRYDYYEFLQEHLPRSDTNPSWWPKAQFTLI